MLHRFAQFAAIAAAASMAAAPLAAADLPQPPVGSPIAAGVFDADAVNADNHRRWRRDRVDAGDVIGGLLVIGTIAAVASAASKSNNRDRYRTRGYPARDYRNDYRPYDSRLGESRGLQNAADMCAREVERDRRVASVDSVVRSADGWRVTGRARSGEGFSCLIGNDGRIADVDYAAAGYNGAAADGQWSDDRYASARAAQDPAGVPSPAYPGGPLPGEAEDIPPVGSTAADYDS